MKRRWMALVLALVVQPAVAQEGAALIDGLGGPAGFGQPHGGDSEIDLAPAFADGLQYYAPAVDRTIRMNWHGSLSFEFGDFDQSRPIPRPLFMGLSVRRIVPFNHSSDLAEFEIGEVEPTIAYYANLPPDGHDSGRFVATWHLVTDRDHNPPRSIAGFNNWQTILTAGDDPANFDIEFRYNRCEWTHGIDRDNRMAVMGFDGGQGDAEGAPGWMWPGSGTDDVRLLCQLSNVGEPGVFRYQVVDGEVTGCGIGDFVPPGEGRCAPRSHLPGTGCSPDCFIEPDIDGDGSPEAPYPGALDPLDAYDNCTDPGVPDCDADRDGDGVPIPTDNCSEISNPDQADYDADGVGNVCDVDADDDILPVPANPDIQFRPEDLCPLLYSVGTRFIDPEEPRFSQQSDLDGDGLGDACDPDDDGDGVLDCGADGHCDPTDDGYDNDRDDETDEPDECADPADCPDGRFDLIDNDGDGYVDEHWEIELPFARWPGPDAPPAQPEDNCRRIPNPRQLDQDGDGVGDACDPDIDGDTVENCDGDGLCGPDADRRDNDRDGVIDERGECGVGCDLFDDLVDQDRDGFIDEHREDIDVRPAPARVDNCPFLANPDQVDSNADGVGDLCADDDEDGVRGIDDNCIGVANVDQFDLDEDGLGDACDPDDDDDGVPDATDVCPRLPDDQTDLDADGIGDACDADDDEDGINDPFDVCPRAYDPDQADLDGDGDGDLCDDDDDGDGAPDGQDVCPRLADDQADLDGDGAGDACDDDDDGDGVDDLGDLCPRVADPEQPDLDGDGLGDACDPSDDRTFDQRPPAEQCAILLRQGASTAHRAAICPGPTIGACRATPGAPSAPWPWIMLAGLAVVIGRRRG